MLTFQRTLSRNFKQLRSFGSSSSALSSKKDEVDEKDEKPSSKDEVTTKLNNLLQMMLQNDEVQPKKDVQLPQAVKRIREKPKKEKPLGEKLAVAAKDVAASLGGDVEKTESELLNILLRRSDSSTQVLRDVLKGIKVEKSEEPTSRAQQVRDSLAGKSWQASEPSASASVAMAMRKGKKKSAAFVDILGATPSSYFKDMETQPAACELRTWQSCVDRDLRLAVTHPPANVYEQLVLWTDQGMLWRFPIDNEQGLEEEKQVPFEEHIFLESHLEGWCPDKGPVRHFMELVCVGLSKNHWLTVEEKKSHIFWYRDYFAEKKELIKELGAGTIACEPGDPSKLFY